MKHKIRHASEIIYCERCKKEWDHTTTENLGDCEFGIKVDKTYKLKTSILNSPIEIKSNGLGWITFTITEKVDSFFGYKYVDSKFTVTNEDALMIAKALKRAVKQS